MTGFFYHPTFLLHDAGPDHPERPERLKAFYEQLEKSSLYHRIQMLAPAPVEREILAFIHSRDYIANIAHASGSAGNGHVRLDADTSVCADSFMAALLAAGAAVEAAETVIRGELANAFCAVRPPGQHAEKAV